MYFSEFELSSSQESAIYTFNITISPLSLTTLRLIHSLITVVVAVAHVGGVDAQHGHRGTPGLVALTDGCTHTHMYTK